jgi:hypothetical protein
MLDSVLIERHAQQLSAQCAVGANYEALDHRCSLGTPSRESGRGLR